MSHSNTAFDKAQIDAQAQRHVDMAQDIAQQLENLHVEVQNTLQGSSSQMTKALEQVYTSWKENVKKVVLDNMNLMAEAMKAEANNQEMQDTDNTRAIMNTVSPVGSFLGG
ncbi:MULTISPECIES: hypothetical protein [Amycolatopsis]|uniref:Uncharacterized protein n=2 Tax=Amycolatopsis TaxID=1813 RepID=A0A1I3WXB0_9PSEU|nr:hypothetical protein [Amycolatopsis sacchari]SFK12033.1 hypothetical protein SAMN05421835_11428 [Amycolatopsis sacchari]